MSGVLASKRKQSPFQVITYVMDIRDEFTKLIVNRLGIKDMEDIFRNKYKEKHDWTYSYEEYRDIVHRERDVLMNLLSNLTANITAANSIYPIDMKEADERRIYQDRAIANCFQLKAELQYIATLMKVNMNRYTQLADMLDTEVGLIKGWRKSDNKIRKKIKENQNEK